MTDNHPHKSCWMGTKPIKADLKKLRNMTSATTENNRANSWLCSVWLRSFFKVDSLSSSWIQNDSHFCGTAWYINPHMDKLDSQTKITGQVMMPKILLHAESLSHVWLFVIPWTAAARLLCPWGFSGEEHWSGFPCPSPGDLPYYSEINEKHW